jgi:hypothetical protein
MSSESGIAYDKRSNLTVPLPGSSTSMKLLLGACSQWILLTGMNCTDSLCQTTILASLLPVIECWSIVRSARASVLICGIITPLSPPRDMTHEALCALSLRREEENVSLNIWLYCIIIRGYRQINQPFMKRYSKHSSLRKALTKGKKRRMIAG